MKTYTVTDLFFTRWSDLSPLRLYEVYSLNQVLVPMEADHPKYGMLLLAVLRRLRKNAALVDKITVPQAVDIYNDMKFLREPWFHFPEVPALAVYDNVVVRPEDYMARHTFDHFIYADNEFSRYIDTHDKTFLRRLLVTLYQQPFDKESVEGLADVVRVPDWLLMLVAITFDHVRTRLSKRCKTLLPPAPAGEHTTASTGPMWLKIKHRLAETPAFQGYSTAGAANMYSALDYLEDIAQQKEKEQRRAAAQTHRPR